MWSIDKARKNRLHPDSTEALRRRSPHRARRELDLAANRDEAVRRLSKAAEDV